MFENESAVFTCVLTGGPTNTWIINGSRPGFFPHLLDDLEFSHFIDDDNSYLHLRLAVPARVEYNGTRFQCQTILDASVSAIYK